MRILILLLFASIVSLFGDASAWTDEDRRIEAEQVALWTNKLAEVASDAPNVKFSELWLGLRNMGHRVSSQGHSPEVDKIYKKLQLKLLSIPGHAEYFGKRIREAYKPLKGPNPGVAIGDAQNEMMYSFATLKNLPSPETVRVLGEMLSETWRMERQPPVFGEVEYTPPSLALSAVASALIELPLREPPKMPIVMFGEDPGVGMVHPWQKWYEEIKSGRRMFSFKGQAVEYRFKQDGTWETIPIANPPDDAPKIPEIPAKEKPVSRPPPEKEVETPKPVGNSWAWIIGAVGAILAGLIWFGARKFKGNG